MSKSRLRRQIIEIDHSIYQLCAIYLFAHRFESTESCDGIRSRPISNAYSYTFIQLTQSGF
jgi:hypothetical protein